MTQWYTVEHYQKACLDSHPSMAIVFQLQNVNFSIICKSTLKKGLAKAPQYQKSPPPMAAAGLLGPDLVKEFILRRGGI